MGAGTPVAVTVQAYGRLTPVEMIGVEVMCGGAWTVMVISWVAAGGTPSSTVTVAVKVPAPVGVQLMSP